MTKYKVSMKLTRFRRAKLSIPQIKQVKKRIEEGATNTLIAKEFNVTSQNISAIRLKKIWADI